MERPQTTLVLAMTADGKISDQQRSPARFSSSEDLAHLERQIAAADGVLFGAGTLRAYGTTKPVSVPQLLQQRLAMGLSPQPVQIVCSASGNLDRGLRFFSQPVPRWLLTTSKGALDWQLKNSKFFEQIIIAENHNNSQIDWIGALAFLHKLGLNKLAILGGGNLAASLLAENLIDEFWLTICPVILGGTDSPTPIEGMGWLAKDAVRLELLEIKRVDQEVFLHYRRQG